MLVTLGGDCVEYWLIETAKKSPTKIAVVTETSSIDYKTLLDRVLITANLIYESIASKSEEKIAIILENRIEYIYLLHAFNFINSIPVLINIRLTHEEISWQLAHLSIEKVIVSKETRDKITNIDQDLVIYSIEAITEKLDHWSKKTIDISDKVFFPNKIQSYIFTSGTTGKPKAAELRYTNIYSSAIGSANRLGVNTDDLWMLTIPLYHVGGTSIVFRSCINSTAVYLDNKFQASKITKLVKKFEISIISLVPSMLNSMMSNNAFSEDLPSLRLILLGGDRTTKELIDKSKKLGLPIATTYGMTETVSQVATALSHDVYTKPQSVGKPIEGLQVKILDETGKNLNPNQAGLIVIKGDAVIQRYHKSEKEPFKSGFNTGDIGYFDADGDLFVLQRRVDLIISGGENIYPSEIEDILLSMKGVAEACVLGIDNKKWGQIPVALIVRSEEGGLSANQVIKHCNKFLGGFKIPKAVKFFSEFPRNSLGKVNRAKLKDILLSITSTDK